MKLRDFSKNECNQLDQIQSIGGSKWWNPLFLLIYVVDEVYEGLTRPCDCPPKKP